MFRPLMTIIEDTIVNQPSEAAARHHSILGAHCNPRFWQSALGTEDHPFARDKNCYYNLVAAVEKVGLPSKLVHDNLNLFQKSRDSAGYWWPRDGAERCTYRRSRRLLLRTRRAYGNRSVPARIREKSAV